MNADQSVTRAEIVIIGAGASGLWSAIELAPDHDVVVLEAGRVGAGASGYAAGFVGPFADWAPYPAAVEHSIEAFRSLDGSHGFTFHDRPYVELAETDAERESFVEDYQPLFDREGYELEYWSTSELAERWPGRFDLDGFDGGLVKVESGIIDVREYATALAETARERGAEIRTQTPVERIVTDDDTVVGVETPDGRIEAETVVCAAGAQTAPLVEPFVDVPTRQFIYCNLRVDIDGEIDDAYPMMYGRDVWWRPEPDRSQTFLISGGMYFLPERDQPPRSPPAEYLREVKAVLESVANDIDEVRIVNGSYHTCSKGSAITPDGQPVLDAPENAPDGLVIVTGVTAGISMSPFTGAAVRALVTGEEPLVSLEPFELDRFDEPSADFRVHEIQEMPSTFPTGEY
ncbi:NAD(P)/FAD-dependent oxidoreductase [Natrialba sp. SSL1]|uniref:NAD(P)/FAD-dependent oxidoreductase n=1 Tax=Natrialba sp. SSL1 TaxID=1869245 RepID=UPI0008F82DC1|nr:FAD-binding oxidoreductase [Natrialba sp. SSL1]OIB59041.1 FAD-dependent oxidoreductase [Natrialba sp. SSL1]